jgi:Leu/Phe-tRNA-protein transferase
MQNEMSDPIKDLQLMNNTAKLFLQVYDFGIFWMTYESESISLTAKRFRAVIQNTR